MDEKTYNCTLSKGKLSTYYSLAHNIISSAFTSFYSKKQIDRPACFQESVEQLIPLLQQLCLPNLLKNMSIQIIQSYLIGKFMRKSILECIGHKGLPTEQHVYT